MNDTVLFLQGHSFNGILIGVSTFFIIGIFHPIVIKTEYYFGVKSWWAFLFAGIAMAVLSFFIDNFFLSTIAGVVSCSCFWSIVEIFEQRKRVMKGWFPKNPKRKHDYKNE